MRDWFQFLLACDGIRVRDSIIHSSRLFCDVNGWITFPRFVLSVVVVVGESRPQDDDDAILRCCGGRRPVSIAKRCLDVIGQVHVFLPSPVVGIPRSTTPHHKDDAMWIVHIPLIRFFLDPTNQFLLLATRINDAGQQCDYMLSSFRGILRGYESAPSRL